MNESKRRRSWFLVAFPRRRTRGVRENEEQEERERGRERREGKRERESKRREKRQADGMEFSNQLGIRLLG